MLSTIDVCFMCINDKNCTDVNKNVLTLVEYILPEITIVKLDINLRICSVCEETVCLFSKFKGQCVENSLLLETTIKEARSCEVNSAKSTTNQPIEEIYLKSEPLPDGTDLKKDGDGDDQNVEGISTTKEVKDENCNQKSETTSKEIYSCRICDTVFKYKCNLSRHMQSHSDKKFKCHTCDAEFGRGYILRDHILKIHSKTKTFPCSECDKKFAISVDLKHHLKRFHKVQVVTKREQVPTTEWQKVKEKIERKVKFVCGICNRTFRRKCHLVQHHKAHETHGKCYICKEPFSHNYHVVGHPDFKHKPRSSKVTIRKRVDCPECKKSIQLDYLKDHHLRLHKKEKDYHCNICHKLFIQSRSLRAHIMVHHSG